MTARWRAAFLGWLALGSAGCWSSVESFSTVKYAALAPEVARGELQAPERDVEVKAVDARGRMAFEVRSVQRCEIVRRPRYQAIKVEGKRGERIATDIVFGSVAAGSGALAAGVAYGVVQSGNYEASVDKALFYTIIGGAVVGGVGLIVLGNGLFHLAQVGTDETPGEIEYGVPPPGRGSGSPATETETKVCRSGPEEGLKLGLLLALDGYQPKIVELGRTNGAGRLTTNVVQALSSALPGWPEVDERVEAAASVVAVGGTESPTKLAELDLARYPGLRYAEHLENQQRVAWRRDRVRAAQERRREEERAAEQRAERERECTGCCETAREEHNKNQQGQAAGCEAQRRSRCMSKCQGSQGCVANCMAQGPGCPGGGGRGFDMGGCVRRCVSSGCESVGAESRPGEHVPRL
ncbi:MAG: hypothetical protein HY744_02455 [Deltaproteobacteria bacterium]|nr:hypothetical protein [Deltaproteobacteria bacterium]